MALKATGKILTSVLVVFLLVSPLLAQTCNAQSTKPEQEKAISFLKEVIQLDVDHYKLTLTDDNMNIDTLRLTYKIEPKAFLSLEKSQTLNFQFYNGSLISFDVQPGSDCLVFVQPRPDRFNAALDILERYQIWLNDPQVDEMATLLQQVGSEHSTFQVSGNLSLRIQLYSNTGEYRFSNYINGVEYSGIWITQSSTGAIFFTDNRASQPIGDTTIGISEEQAKTIAENYVATHPFRGTTQNSREVTNLSTLGVKAVFLKSTVGDNAHVLYPYYEVQFNIEADSVLDGCGVNVGANDGEVWNAYSYSSSTGTNSIAQMLFFFFPILPLLVIVVVVVVIVLLLSRRNRSRTELPVAA